MADDRYENAVPYSLETSAGETLCGVHKYSGQGTASYPNGDIYEGNFENGNRQNNGVYTFANGNRFEGPYLDAKKNGLGRLIFSAGGFFHGHFVQGVRQGLGTRVFANGDVYYGEWENGKMHGTGTYRHKIGNFKLQGTWEKNALKVGRWVWSNGTYFQGKFKLNQPDGEGFWYFPNGTRLQGTYSQKVWPLDDVEDGYNRLAQRVELAWVCTTI